MEEVLDIKLVCFALGRSLRLRNDDLEAIRKKNMNLIMSEHLMMCCFYGLKESTM